MIIFDLDGTLANFEHRRHFISYHHWVGKQKIGSDLSKFKPDWKSFYESCDKDEPIKETVDLLHRLFECELDIHIWSGRCESVREKTEEWLLDNIKMKYCVRFNPSTNLKMRPIGDSTPDEILKEKWLDEALAVGNNIDFVFDAKVVRMWGRKGIFVFNCCQHDMSFYAN